MTKILNATEFVNEKLGIQPVTKTRLASIKRITDELIEKYDLVYNEETGLYDYGSDDGGLGNMEKNLVIEDDLVSNGRLIIRFGDVFGSFICKGLNLKSLEGSPESVEYDFDCSHNQLTSLDGAPESVGGDFYCNNNQLKTLKNAPYCTNTFDCSHNQLISLEGAPEDFSLDFDCSYNNLTSLDNAPKEVEQYFDCSHNKLTTLKDVSITVKGGDFDCSDNPLTTLDDAQINVNGDIISDFGN